MDDVLAPAAARYGNELEHGAQIARIAAVLRRAVERRGAAVEASRRLTRIGQSRLGTAAVEAAAGAVIRRAELGDDRVLPCRAAARWRREFERDTVRCAGMLRAARERG